MSDKDPIEHAVKLLREDVRIMSKLIAKATAAELPAIRQLIESRRAAADALEPCKTSAAYQQYARNNTPARERGAMEELEPTGVQRLNECPDRPKPIIRRARAVAVSKSQPERI